MEDIEKCFRFDEEKNIAMDLEIRFEQHVPEKNPLKFD